MNADCLNAGKEAARSAGLRYVSEAVPGVRRLGACRFRYVGPDGRAVRDAATLARIRALAIPPAWTDVWICAFEHGHIQATGRDARARKQYRYHAQWRIERDAGKYERMLAFGHAMSRIRAAVARDLALAGLPREKVLATVMRLLELTCIRVGNEEYARTNKSFGLTTLRSRHVEVDGSAIKFRFRGKSGKVHSIGIRDRRLARIVRQCEELPGQRLFEYLDVDGGSHPVESSDVNDYIRNVSGGDFTAKDFRTLAGTLLAARSLREAPRGETQAELKRAVNDTVRQVARRLGNTVSVCRKCYIHPCVIDAFMTASLGDGVPALHDEEAAIMRLLEKDVLPDLVPVSVAAAE
ncbi:MAG TPA: DNA topoisomerase IB [Polyangiaceae bacterium]